MQSRRFFQLLTAILLIANGGAMLALPETWYLTVPGVTHTGPLNLHFVRDIGCSYLVAGLGFLRLWYAGNRVWHGAAAGCLFLLLHAGVHLGEFIGGTTDMMHLAIDMPGVILVPIAAVFVLGRPGKYNSFHNRESARVEMASQSSVERI